MPNPKLETYKNKATNTVYDLTDADAQGKLTAILDGTTIDSFADVESALDGKVDVVTGKGLSTNDYDNTAKGIVDNIQSNVIANTKLIKDTVGWSGKNKLAIKFSYVKANIVGTWSGNTVTINGISLSFEVDSNGYVTKITGGGSNASADTTVVFIPRTSPDGLILPTGSYKANGTPTLPNGCFVRYFCTRGESVVVFGDDTGSGVDCAIQNTDVVGCLISVESGKSVNGLVFNLMLRDADILDSTYEPYFGSTAFPRSEQAVLGAKNLLICNAVSETRSDVTITVNSDKTITLNGTASAQFNLDVVDLKGVLPKGRYKLSGCTIAGSASGFRGYINYQRGGVRSDVVDIGNGAEFEVYGDETTMSFSYLVPNGFVLSNVTLKPMIRLATDSDDTYVPYAMTNRELTENVQGKLDKNNYVGTIAALIAKIPNNQDAYVGIAENTVMATLTNNSINTTGKITAFHFNVSTTEYLDWWALISSNQFAIGRYDMTNNSYVSHTVLTS